MVYDFQVMDDRTVVDARQNLENIEVGNGTMRVALRGKNLTDGEYSVFAINFGSSLGLITEDCGDPRTWGIELAFEY